MDICGFGWRADCPVWSHCDCENHATVNTLWLSLRLMGINRGVWNSHTCSGSLTFVVSYPIKMDVLAQAEWIYTIKIDSLTYPLSGRLYENENYSSECRHGQLCTLKREINFGVRMCAWIIDFWLSTRPCCITNCDVNHQQVSICTNITRSTTDTGCTQWSSSTWEPEN